MKKINRKEFIRLASLYSGGVFLFRNAGISLFNQRHRSSNKEQAVSLDAPKPGEDIFSYIQRKKGSLNLRFYQQIVGAANEFKEGDLTLGVAADSSISRAHARTLLSNTKVLDLHQHSLFEDDLEKLIRDTTISDEGEILDQSLGELKEFLLSKNEESIKEITPYLSSDVIASVVKLMTNEELIAVSSKVFNPLPKSNIGGKGYLSARVQPNSPTDNVDDIVWQVFDAWCYSVGDLVLGTNPVSSEPASVAKIERALHDILLSFDLEETMPHCVLSHIDIQAQVDEQQHVNTGIWFQSLAGTVNANQTFDVSLDKMFKHASKRKGQYGLYAETGQGADFTNGHGEGFDMVVHESRKYGFLRALKLAMAEGKTEEETPWVHVNDVAGFIGPEVFKTKEQLVRCCLEDTTMGKLHGLPIGLDICSTLHMDVSLDDLDWCIEQIMPANPAYLMALPTKNDPMLSYLTTAFHNHLKIREQFGYKVNDKMWSFFKKLKIIDVDGKPTSHFGDPIWVYYQYRLAKGDTRLQEEIYDEGRKKIKEVRDRGVPIAEGYGENIWDLKPELDKEVRELYEDAKVSLWTELGSDFTQFLPAFVAVQTHSKDRKDYVYHPESGEKLTSASLQKLQQIKSGWIDNSPDVQIILSDGLNARALMDEGHLKPFLKALQEELIRKNYSIAKEGVLITNGRVRAGYACGEELFGVNNMKPKTKGVVHIIGERPGSGHHNFSAYLTAANQSILREKGRVDHDISRVVSGISNTALLPEIAARETVEIFDEIFKKSMKSQVNPD